MGDALINTAQTTSLEPRRIGYLPFYVSFYEDIHAGFRAEKAEFARECGEQLARFGEVVWDGRVIETVEQARAAGDALAAQGVDCIVVVTTLAVFAGIPLEALMQCAAPVVLWNPELAPAPPANYDMVQVVRNTTQIGVQALANTLLREGRWFRVVTGYRYGDHTLRSLDRIFRILDAACAVRNARLLEIGGGFPLMTDIELDDAFLANNLGASVTHISGEELHAKCRGVNREAIDVARIELERGHEMVGMDAVALERSIRLSLAVDSFAREHRASAGSVNCHACCRPSSEVGVTACLALGVQNTWGRPFTCTGDLPTALAMLMLKRLAGSSLYTEVQIVDAARNAVVVSNSGEGEESMRREEHRSTIRPCTNFSGACGRGASFAYPIRSGPATLVSFTPTPRGAKPFRVIAAEGEVLADLLPEIGSVAGLFRFASGDVHDAYTRWLEAGAVHHAATAAGCHARELAEICELVNAEFVGV